MPTCEGCKHTFVNDRWLNEHQTTCTQYLEMKKEAEKTPPEGVMDAPPKKEDDNTFIPPEPPEPPVPNIVRQPETQPTFKVVASSHPISRKYYLSKTIAVGFATDLPQEVIADLTNSLTGVVSKAVGEYLKSHPAIVVTLTEGE